MVGDTHSGSGEASQTLVLVKPLKANLQTNLLIATNQGLSDRPAERQRRLSLRRPVDLSG